LEELSQSNVLIWLAKFGSNNNVRAHMIEGERRAPEFTPEKIPLGPTRCFLSYEIWTVRMQSREIKFPIPTFQRSLKENFLPNSYPLKFLQESRVPNDPLIVNNFVIWEWFLTPNWPHIGTKSITYSNSNTWNFPWASGAERIRVRSRVWVLTSP
jgi:hypothetical protein